MVGRASHCNQWGFGFICLRTAQSGLQFVSSRLEGTRDRLKLFPQPAQGSGHGPADQTCVWGRFQQQQDQALTLVSLSPISSEGPLSHEPTVVVGYCPLQLKGESPTFPQRQGKAIPNTAPKPSAGSSGVAEGRFPWPCTGSWGCGRLRANLGSSHIQKTLWAG